jgi:ATP-dependent protease ClpP protease subunit
MRNKTTTETKGAIAAPKTPARVPKSTGVLTGVLHSRRVPLRGLITERIAACCINRILVLAADNRRQPIIIEVESPGGSVREALSIIRTINGISCPVATFSRGYVGGAAVMIAAHGRRGFRVAVPATRFQLAPGLSTEPNHDVGPWHSVLQILAAASLRPEAEIEQWLRVGAEFDPQKAVASGIVDVIGTKPLFPESAILQG